MSVVNQFDADSIRYSNAERKTYLRGRHIPDYTFPFTFFCVTKAINPKCWTFFDFISGRCLLVMMSPNSSGSGSNYSCSVLRFWVENDLPVLSAHIFDNQKKLIDDLSQQFREAYAAYTLDNIINS